MDQIIKFCRDAAITSFSSSISSLTAQASSKERDEETHFKDNMNNEKPKSSDAIFVSYEKYLIVLQSLLLWDKPKDTLVALITFTICYWCLVWMSSSILSLIFTTCFLLAFLDIWREKLWPEIRVPPTEDELEEEAWMLVHPQALSAPELISASSRVNDEITSLFKRLRDLRAQNHALFCFSISSFLTLTAIVGRMIPGSLLLYCILTLIALTPGICLVIPFDSWSKNLCKSKTT